MFVIPGPPNSPHRSIKTLILFTILALTLSSCSQQEGEQEIVPEARQYPSINDTGITFGGNYPKHNASDCSASIDKSLLAEGEDIDGNILNGQDCTIGRDAANGDNSNGHAGFEYLRINHHGEVVSTNSGPWFCVLDKTTGLLWEIKQPPDNQYGNRGLHDADDVFTWYNTTKATNGGEIGDWNARYDQCTGYVEGQPVTYCNIEEFANRVNEQGLCNFNDWRVPSKAELETLVNYGRTQPALDTDYFPDHKGTFYWSITPTAGQPTTAWAVNFEWGYSAPIPRSGSYQVRLVRSW